MTNREGSYARRQGGKTGSFRKEFSGPTLDIQLAVESLLIYGGNFVRPGELGRLAVDLCATGRTQRGKPCRRYTDPNGFSCLIFLCNQR